MKMYLFRFTDLQKYNPKFMFDLLSASTVQDNPTLFLHLSTFTTTSVAVA